jgi:hypothetical protein
MLSGMMIVMKLVKAGYSNVIVRANVTESKRRKRPRHRHSCTANDGPPPLSRGLCVYTDFLNSHTRPYIYQMDNRNRREGISVLAECGTVDVARAGTPDRRAQGMTAPKLSTVDLRDP